MELEERMEEMKLCPLKLVGTNKTLMHEDFKRKTCKCDGHPCAWWNAEKGCCSVAIVNK